MKDYEKLLKEEMKNKPLNKKEAADFLSIGIRALEGLMARRAIPYYLVTKRCVRFLPKDLEKFLEKVRVDDIGT